MRKSICLVILIAAVFADKNFSQTVSQQEIQKMREIETGERDPGRSKNNVQPQPVEGRRRAMPLKAKRTREQNRHLLPSQEDFSKFSSFLQQPKTGLIKLFSDLGCEEDASIIHASEQCLKYIPNSAFYSFREREHSNEYLSDLRIEKDNFVTDGVLSQGILVSLGDVSLENLTLNSNGMKFLSDFAPASSSKDALKQNSEFIKGVKANEFVYKKSLPVLENKNYAMRVVAYQGKYWQVFRGVNYDALAGDDRADLIIVFRVVRKSGDGEVTLLWRELQRKEAPKIVFPKKPKS